MSILHRLFLSAILCLASMPLGAQITLPDRMYGDTAHAPFLFGVASGDPLTDRVLIWTKVDHLPGQTAPINLDWELAADPAFATIVQSGAIQATHASDWTILVDVSGLLPGSRYWYRFRDGNGNLSMVGRTQTAPAGSNTQFRVGIASCSSVYSGYFNAYERIGQRHDLDLFVHLGDYIYDFVDADEEIRVPVPYPAEPATLQEWRDRHAYYLLDPDLRLARARLPWAVIWDNHDLDGASGAGAKQAFFEYVPVRRQDTASMDKIYRKLSFGNLVDLFLVDATTLRDVDTLPNGDFSILGDSQWTWLSAGLLASTAQWKLIGNERMMSNFSLAGLPSFIPFGDGPVADSGAWDGYDGDRMRLLNFLSQNGIDNSVVISGDIHMSFACDLAPDNGAYDPQTGAGSAAVEFLPSSITRGNFDEQGFGGFIATLAQAAMSAANPHHVYQELESHGYGILDIRPARAVAEFWYSEILQHNTTETFATAFQCLDGANHWDRSALANPTVGLDRDAALETQGSLLLSPNPIGVDGFDLAFRQSYSGPVQVSIFSGSSGQLIEVLEIQDCVAGSNKVFIPSRNLAAGFYLVRVQTSEGFLVAKALKLGE